MATTPEPTDTSERLVFFTDAVAAIALTLLALPLVDLVREGVQNRLSLSELLGDNLHEFGAFLLSFLVISRFWWAHHRLFRHIAFLNRAIVGWNVVWTLSIVVLPVPTAIITAYAPSPGTVALYCGTLVLTSGSLTMLALAAYRHPEVSKGRSRESREEVLGNGTAFVAQLLAMLIGTVFAETVNFWALTLMLLTGPVETLVKRRWAADTGRHLSSRRTPR